MKLFQDKNMVNYMLLAIVLLFILLCFLNNRTNSVNHFQSTDDSPEMQECIKYEKKNRDN